MGLTVLYSSIFIPWNKNDINSLISKIWNIREKMLLIIFIMYIVGTLYL